MHLDEGEEAVGGWTGASFAEVFVQVCLRGGIYKTCPFDVVSVIQTSALFVQLITLHHFELKLTLNRKHDEHLLHLE